MSFDLNLNYNILPYDKLTPYLFAGIGTNASNYFDAIDPKIQGGIGLEYLLKDNIGIYAYGEHNLVFSDNIDGIEAGTIDDMFYRFGIGVNYYFSQPSTKFNERKELERLKKKELKALKKENRRKMQEQNRNSKINNSNN